MLLTFVRHGETAKNLQRIIQGHDSTPLNATGLAQADRVGACLATSGVRFDRIYVSDLVRTRQTIEQYLSRMPHMEPLVIYTPLLREKGGGILEGLPLETMIVEAQKAGVSVRQFHPEGGESWEDVSQRTRSFFVLLQEQFPDVEVQEDGSASVPHVLVVSHGGWLVEFFSSVLGLKHIPKPRNASISTYHISRLGHVDKVVVENDISHLSGLGALESGSIHLTESSFTGNPSP